VNIHCCHKPDCQDIYCPGRPTRVAKIGQRYPKHPQPYPDSIWRRHLKALARFFLLGLLGWLIWVPLLYLLLRA
jgi:hypothetical protein